MRLPQFLLRNDLAWDAESKRIIAVGDGREKYALLSDNRFDAHGTEDSVMCSCSTLGHQPEKSAGTQRFIFGYSLPIQLPSLLISGASFWAQVINAVSMNSQRPFRAVTASDDTGIVFYHGVYPCIKVIVCMTYEPKHPGAPYKYAKTIKVHNRFVQDVRFAPSGDLFASVGSDARGFLYDGKTGDMKADLGEGIHGGTIVSMSSRSPSYLISNRFFQFAVTWSPDSHHFATSSADRTVKLCEWELFLALDLLNHSFPIRMMSRSRCLHAEECFVLDSGFRNSRPTMWKCVDRGTRDRQRFPKWRLEYI